MFYIPLQQNRKGLGNGCFVCICDLLKNVQEKLCVRVTHMQLTFNPLILKDPLIKLPPGSGFFVDQQDRV